MLCFKLLMIICEQALTLHWIYHYLYVVSNLYEFSSSMEHKEIYSTRQNVYTKQHQSTLTFIASLLYTMKVNGDWVLLLYSLEKRKTNLWLKSGYVCGEKETGNTFCSAREAVHFEVAGTLLPPVFFAVGMGRRGWVHFWTGGAGYTRTGAHRISQTSI